MAEISKITLPSGNTYDLKDATARAEISQIAKAGLVYVKVDVLPAPSEDTLGKIYLVPHNQATQNVYDEYITIGSASGGGDGFASGDGRYYQSNMGDPLYYYSTVNITQKPASAAGKIKMEVKFWFTGTHDKSRSQNLSLQNASGTKIYDFGNVQVSSAWQEAGAKIWTIELATSAAQSITKLVWGAYNTINLDMSSFKEAEGYNWERLGSTDIDLSGYALKGDSVTIAGTAANATTGISIANHTVTQGTTSSKVYYNTDEVYGTGTTFTNSTSSVSFTGGTNDSVLGADTTATVPAYTASRSYIGATATGTAVGVATSSDAITGFGNHSSDTFIKSYAGATAKLATTSVTGTNGTVDIPNVTGNTSVTIPNVTGNTSVTATKMSSYGSLPTLTTTVANETLTIGFSQGTLPQGSDVTATNTTLGTALTATNTTLGTAIKAAKVASSATTVATGKTASSDTNGDIIMTGLGTATSASALTALGTPTTETFAKTVSVTTQPTIALSTNTSSATGRVQLATNISTSGTNTVTFGGNDNVTAVTSIGTGTAAAQTITVGTGDKVNVVKTISGSTSTGATEVSISGTNSGIGVSAHSVTDNGHTHTVSGSGTINLE